MENIMIINDKKPFQEGLSKLIEFRFGSLFEIINTDPKKLKNYDEIDSPRLIIVDEIVNSSTVEFLNEMRDKGSKIVLLSLEANTILDFELDLFNGFLLKNMQTSEMLQVMEEIIDYNEVYVHPDIGCVLLKKLIDKN